VPESDEPQILLGKAHSLGLVWDRDGARVTVAGEIDMAAAEDLSRLLASLDRVNTAIRVDLTQVTFLDTYGAEPLIEASRRRAALGLRPLLLAGTSRQVRRLLKAAGIGGGRTIDVPAWDRFNAQASRYFSGGQ
jgi:anti-sigma B factor antagonist